MLLCHYPVVAGHTAVHWLDLQLAQRRPGMLKLEMRSDALVIIEAAHRAKVRLILTERMQVLLLEQQATVL